MSPRVLVVLALALAACAAPPPPASPPAPGAEPAASPAPSGAASAGASAEQCFATADAVRARSGAEPAKVGVKHVLVKYKGAKNAPATIARSRAEACLRAVEARDKLRGGADFDAVVKEYSDEAGAATRGGSLGTVERKEVAKAFADAAFELRLDEMSDVVETEFGFHLILRNE
jgi:parvulin-like peptidyl-prolyl isomerase